MRLVEGIAVNGCPAAAFDGLIWRFPCGLAVAGELAAADNPAGMVEAVRAAHERHHVGGHETRMWDITVTDNGDGTFEATCGCRS